MPRGLAVVADKRNVASSSTSDASPRERRERALRTSRSLAEKIGSLRVVIRARAGEEGKLYGSVTNIDVEKALAAQGVHIERRRIRLEEPIKTLGEFRVPVQLDVGVTAELTVSVEPQAEE